MNTAKDQLLGVNVDNLSRKDILAKINSFLVEKKFHQISTVNAEFILEAQKNEKFRNVLNSSDLNVADSVSIWYAFLRFGKILRARFTGVDLMYEILGIAEQKNIPVFLAAKYGGLSSFEETKTAILKKFPSLTISGDNIDIKNTSYKILNTRYQVLFCNFGAPHQELFINSQKCDTIQLAIGVGGAFDFLTGKARRAPIFIRKIGMEWFWRVFQLQEWKFKKQRLKRIFLATIVFPIRVVFNR